MTMHPLTGNLAPKSLQPIFFCQRTEFKNNCQKTMTAKILKQIYHEELYEQVERKFTAEKQGNKGGCHYTS